jgi:hypothetical protein
LIMNMSVIIILVANMLPITCIIHLASIKESRDSGMVSLDESNGRAMQVLTGPNILKAWQYLSLASLLIYLPLTVFEWAISDSRNRGSLVAIAVYYPTLLLLSYYCAKAIARAFGWRKT